MVSATALIAPKPGAPFQRRSVELDEVRQHEVLVDVKATGIRHTDIAVQQRKLPMRLPGVLGHEGAGVVRMVGSAVKDVQPGDHVVVSYNFCGSWLEVTREAVMKYEGLDAAVYCTGVLPVINEMIELVGPGGMAVTVGGTPPGTKATVDVFDMLIKCKTYSGCHQGNACSKAYIPWLADLYAAGQFPLQKLQKAHRAEDINQACQDMLDGKVLKPVLLWD